MNVVSKFSLVFIALSSLAGCESGGGSIASAATNQTAPAPLVCNLNVTNSYSSGGYYGIYDEKKGTEQLVFSFNGSSFFGKDGFANLQHLFVVMQGRLGDPGDALQGIGLAIGNTSARQDGCDGVIIENFEGGTNELYPTSCTPISFQDGEDYRVVVSSSVDGTVVYQIFDSSGALLGSKSIANVQNVNQTNQGSIMMGLTTPPNNANGGMSINIASYTNN